MENNATQNSQDTLQTLLDIATTAYYRYDYLSAAEVFATTSHLAKTAGCKDIEIRAVIGKGKVFRRQGDFQASLAEFNQAVTIAREIQNHSLISDALTGKGDTLRSLNHYEDALVAHEEALKESHVASDHRAAAYALRGKGEALRMLDRHSDAFDAHQEALKESSACEDSHWAAWTAAYALCGKGKALRMLDRYKEALDTYEMALKESRACGNRWAEAYALSGKGHALRMLNSHDEAFAANHEALQVSRICKNHWAEANALIGIGEASERIGEFGESSQAFNDANLLGRKFGYGYAITRAQAGLRRLASAEKPASSEAQSKTDQVDGKISDPAVVLLESRVVSVFGPDSIKDFSINSSVRMQQLQSMLPDKRMKTVALMCDIRGYTTIMAQADPEEQIPILDRYLARGTELIQEHGGGVDKYMGDAILGFFLPTNVETPSEKEYAETVYAAIESAMKIANDAELKSLFMEFGSRFKNSESNTFGIGVGLATGWAKFGEIGARWRREYTLIGRPVNLVARVQSVARAWEVVATQECWNKLTYHAENENFSSHPLDVSSIDGRSISEKMRGFEDVNLVVISRKKP